MMGSGVELDLSAEVPQRSVIGPDLRQGCQTMGFADDLALLVEADDTLALCTGSESG